MREIMQASGRIPRLILSLLLTSFMLVLIFKTLNAQVQEIMPPDLSGSTKEVDRPTASPGRQLHYSVVISNSGDQPAIGVQMTDTLVSEMTYVTGSLSVIGGGLYGEQGGVITWTGAVNNDTEIMISFDTLLTETIPGGTVVTNTAIVAHDSSILELSTTTTIISDTGLIIFLPLISKEPSTVIIYPIGRPTSANEWTLSWSVSDPIGVTGYEIQEDSNPSFPNPTDYSTDPSTLSLDRQLPISNINIYFYRVRALGGFGIGAWSATQAIVVNYRDDFTDPGTGWRMRRQDTDHIENQTRYENGEFVHEMDSSWDYLIAGPMALIPAPPYRLEMRARHVEPENLNSYGMVFGGDWNAPAQCPASNFTTCFNQYYRMNIIWFGDDNHKLRVILKRIDFHDPSNNHGRGETIIDAVDVSTQGVSSAYQRWAVEVHANGTIKIFINGNFVAQTVDTAYINRPYFGTFSSTDEYAGLEAHFDWFQATALP